MTDPVQRAEPDAIKNAAIWVAIAICIITICAVLVTCMSTVTWIQAQTDRQALIDSQRGR